MATSTTAGTVIALPPLHADRAELAPLAEDASATVMADIAHPPPWGWKVSSYFVSKGVAAGAMMLAPRALMLSPAGAVVIAVGAATAAGVDGTTPNDPDLLDEVTDLVEAPAPVLGSFEEKYLELAVRALHDAFGLAQEDSQ